MAGPRKFRSVLFDLDGTLIDSRPGIFAGLRYTLRRLGHDLPEEQALDWTIGPPLRQVMARLLEPFGDPRVQEAVAEYRSWYGADGLFDATPYPGIPELLDRLVASQRVLFVSTAKQTTFARAVLTHLGLAGRFRVIRGVEPGGLFEHKPDLVRHLLESEGLHAAETVLVGDRQHDLEAARANGVAVIGALWGYGSHAELQDADHVCVSRGELMGLLCL
jgi:phosphoglycolate phosphatase